MNTTLYPMTLFYDASCAVCALEMDHLRARNTHNKLMFIDIHSESFDPRQHGLETTTRLEMMAQIHAQCADGTWLRGMPVLRNAYAAVGLGWVLRPTGYKPVQPLFDLAYRVFAQHRQTISGVAAPLIALIRQRRAAHTLARMQACQKGHCEQK